MTHSKPIDIPAQRERDQLLARIRTLVREVNREKGANGASMGAQMREIERLRLALAEWVKRNPI
jgi:hypothetical protein